MQITDLREALATGQPVKLQDLVSSRRVKEHTERSVIAAAEAARTELERHDATRRAEQHGDVRALAHLGAHGVYAHTGTIAPDAPCAQCEDTHADHPAGDGLETCPGDFTEGLYYLGGLSDLERWDNGVEMAEIDYDGPRRWVSAADVVLV